MHLPTILLNLFVIGSLAGLAVWANRMIKARQARDRAAVIAQLRRYRAPGPQLSQEEVAYGLALAMGSIKSGKQVITLPAEAPQFTRAPSALMQDYDTRPLGPELDPEELVYLYRWIGGQAIPTGKRALTAEERAVLC